MLRTLLAASVAVGSAVSAHAFALLGPLDTWQSADLYYDLQPPGIYGEDIGGPQNLGEEYRWNVPTIFYSFDYAFLDYFGQEGVEQVEEAIAAFNALPDFSEMSADLREYPNATMRVNYRASALQLVDLRTVAMSLILEELGVAHAERFVWTLRERELLPGATCPVYRHRVIKRNFDPVTWFPTSYVNDVLYTFLIEISCGAPEYSHALEYPVDPTAIGHTSASSLALGLTLGGYRKALTRDDVGALRYLYRASNYNNEDIPPGSTVGLGGAVAGGGAPAGGGGGGGNDAWIPITPPSTNVVVDPADPGTGTAATVGLRPGVNRVRFVRVNYDSVLGSAFDAFTNTYSSPIVSNGRLVNQTVRRPVLVPDMVFSALDLLDSIGDRTQPNYAQAPVPDGGADLNGPGVLPPGVFVRFNKIGPRFENVYPQLGEDGSTYLSSWGSFDGSTNAPVIYPSHISIQDLERQVLGR